MTPDEPGRAEGRELEVEILIRDRATGEALTRVTGIAASERHIGWETEYEKPPEDLYDLNYRTMLHRGGVQCLHLRIFAPKPLDGVVCTVHDLRTSEPSR